MGITIHYSGRLNDPGLIMELISEMRLLAKSRCWEYTVFDDDWTVEADAHIRYKADGGIEIKGNLGLKGIILKVHPDCEDFSLLFDSKGHMRSFPGSAWDKAGETSRFIFVKTQLSPPEVHILIAGLLQKLKKNFVANLEVSDEGEFWETGDRDVLEQKMYCLRHRIDFLSNTLNSEQLLGLPGLPPEELADRIERMCQSTIQGRPLKGMSRKKTPLH